MLTKKTIVIRLILILLTIVILTGCFESTDQTGLQITDQEKIVGTWKFFAGEGPIIKFYSNGTFIKDHVLIKLIDNGTYEFDDEKLIISTFFNVNYSDETIYDYWFSKNDNRLTLRQEGSIGDEPYNRVL